MLARRVLRKRDLHNRATKRVHSNAHLDGNERAEAVGTRAEQHEKTAPKTELMVRRTSPLEAPDTI